MEPTHMFNGDTLTTYMQDAPAVYFQGAPADIMFARSQLNPGLTWTSDMVEEAKREHIRELNAFYAKAEHV